MSTELEKALEVEFEKIRITLEKMGSEIGKLRHEQKDIMEKVNSIEENIPITDTPPIEPLTPILTPPVDPTVPWHSHMLPNPPMPSKYRGDPKDYKAFTTQCSLHFLNKPQAYATDCSKVMFILMNLEGNALKWATPLIDKNDPLLYKYDDFLRTFASMFESKQEKQMRKIELLDYKQGNQDTQNYVTHFQLLASSTNWPDDVLVGLFYRGLKDNIKDVLANIIPLPSAFDSFLLLTIQIDQRINERKNETQQTESNYQRFLRPQSNETKNSLPLPLDENSFGEPMQIGGVRKHLSDRERERRRCEGLCFYCGDASHRIAACPLTRRKNTMNHQGSSSDSHNSLPRKMGTVSTDAPSAPHIYLDIVIKSASMRELHTKALLDCGANGNYMDKNLQAQYQIPIRKRKCPEHAMSVDDSPLTSGIIDYNTCPLQLTFQGLTKDIQFDLIDTPSFGVILGMPWLMEWNPDINWVTRTLTFSNSEKRYVPTTTVVPSNKSDPQVRTEDTVIVASPLKEHCVDQTEVFSDSSMLCAIGSHRPTESTLSCLIEDDSQHSVTNVYAPCSDSPSSTSQPVHHFFEGELSGEEGTVRNPMVSYCKQRNKPSYLPWYIRKKSKMTRYCCGVYAGSRLRHLV